MRNFKTFDFWIDSKNLAIDIIKTTRTFPKEELYGLVSQIRRAAISIPSNIAEGAGRYSNSDFVHFLDIALGSCYEVETQIEISKEVGFISEQQAQTYIETLKSLERRIIAFINATRKNNLKHNLTSSNAR